MIVEISKLDPKYFVLKNDDIMRFLNEDEICMLEKISTKISNRRHEEGKENNEYAVLNLSDAFDVGYFNKKWTEYVYWRVSKRFDKEKNTWVEKPLEPDIVRDVAILLINSILITDK